MCIQYYILLEPNVNLGRKMKKRLILLILLLLSTLPLWGIEIEIVRVSDDPLVLQIFVFNDGEPPVEITDFHFSVSMPCQIVGASGPPGWTLRYALPNSFVEMDAPPGGAIMPGEGGEFVVELDGPCEDATYTFYLTGPEGVIPGTEREGPIPGPLEIDVQTAPKMMEIAVSPNPFNSACAISVPARAKIEIVDMSGRLVAEYSCGCSRTSWKWSPDESVKSGVYLVRALLADGKSETKRVVFLK